MESHEQDLLDEIHDLDKVRKIQDDYRQIDLGTATRKLLDFAVKLTLSIKDMKRADIESLRESGFKDEDILDAVQRSQECCWAIQARQCIDRNAVSVENVMDAIAG